jgi:hypothetical protein
MKTLIFIIAVFISTVFISCKKNNASPSTNALANTYWFGTFTSGSAVKEGEYFKSDGTTVEYDFVGTTSTDTATCLYKGYGTYSLSGNAITMQVTFPTANNQMFNFVLTLNSSVNPNTIIGTYSGSGSGTINFAKQ